MTSRAIATLVCSLLLLQGCAGVQVQRAKDLSSAAVRYSDATLAVIDAAADAAINADTQAQLRATRPATTDEARERRREELEKLNKGLVETVALYQSLRSSVRAVKAYFVALQDLAEGSQADGTEAAVKSLGERVNGLSAALEGSAASSKPRLSAARIDAIAGLAGKVAEQVHGAKVAASLRRDAPIIGKALALQERVLTTAGDDIRNDLNQINNVFFVDRVQRPFAEGTPGSNWAADRRTYLKTRALHQTEAVVSTAAAAAGQMQAVWERILAGGLSAAAFTLMLKETEELLDTANTLKAAMK